MEGYMSSIRESAMAIMDNAHAWTGGLFHAIGTNDFIYDAAINKNMNKQVLVNDFKSEMLSGGTLAAIVCSVLLSVILLLITICSVCSNFRQFNHSSKQFGRKVRARVNNIDNQLPVQLRILFGIVFIVLMLLAIIPLVLAFATNSKMHAHMSETNSQRAGVLNQLNLTLSHADKFLRNLVPQLRNDLQPVLDHTLMLTKQMKNKSQSKYQLEFQRKIGAIKLLESSDELLSRIKMYYDTADKYLFYDDQLDRQLNNLNEEFTSISTFCNSEPLAPNITKLCYKYDGLLHDISDKYKSIYSAWSQPSESNPFKLVVEIVNKLKSLLDASSGGPDEMEKIKVEKMKIKTEFNKNITSVFDRELNSTEFLLKSVNEKVDDLEIKISAAIQKLSSSSAKITSSFSTKAAHYDKSRYLIILIILLVLLLALIYIATASSIALVMPNIAAKRLKCINFGVYLSYCLYVIVILFTCILFCISTMVNNYICRYLMEQPKLTGSQLSIIDQSLVPDVNIVLNEMKELAKADENKTDAIPITQLGRLVDGIRIGCRDNQPLIKAMQAMEFIDYNTSDSSKASTEFKIKGRDILRREMSNANLKVLYDKDLIKKMQNLLTTNAVKDLAGFDFMNFYQVLNSSIFYFQNIFNTTEQMIQWNEDIASNSSNGLFIRLMTTEKEKFTDVKSVLDIIKNITEDYFQIYQQLESRKDFIPLIRNTIEGSTTMNGYLLNQSLWTETAVEYYTMYVIDGTIDESREISQSATRGFMSILAKCRSVYDLYQSGIAIPCNAVLYPLSIIWFCFAWCITFAILSSLFLHLSLVCFVSNDRGLVAGAKNRSGTNEVCMQPSQSTKNNSNGDGNLPGETESFLHKA